jgi:hypothetical protein
VSPKLPEPRESLGKYQDYPLLKPNFPQWLSAFFNGFLIFLDGFPLSKKSKKIYLRRQVSERLLLELCISCHLLPKLFNSRYNVYISPNTGGNVRPDRMWLCNLASRKGLTIGL